MSRPLLSISQFQQYPALLTHPANIRLIVATTAFQRCVEADIGLIYEVNGWAAPANLSRTSMQDGDVIEDFSLDGVIGMFCSFVFVLPFP